MVTKRISSVLLGRKKLGLLVLMVVSAFVFSMSTSAQDSAFQLAPQNKLEKFYDAQFERFYDHVPADIIKKHSKTIARADKKIKDGKLVGAITTQASQFDLGYYRDVIRIGVLPYLDAEDPLVAELEALTADIDKHTIDYDKLSAFNKKRLGENAPAPTTIGDVASEESVRTSLNGNGYNATNAINYAFAWTDNSVSATRNQQYSFYNGMNDCTNFVSQVLKAGGLYQVRTDTWGYDYDDAPNWYYANTWNNPPSWTWGGAHNQYWHLKDWSANVRRVYSTADLRVGDLVMWDTNPGDGTFHIGHNTVVTKIQNGTIYLTYHSNDRENEPIATLFNRGYLAYGWAINH